MLEKEKSRFGGERHIFGAGLAAAEVSVASQRSLSWDAVSLQ